MHKVLLLDKMTETEKNYIMWIITFFFSLRRGPGANVQDSSGYTALHHASLNGHR